MPAANNNFDFAPNLRRILRRANDALRIRSIRRRAAE
jgi:hypothetical protein